jgi:predicted GNAT family N-acyltransferase
LWANKPIEFVKVPEDAKGHHFGGFLNGALICVISLFVKENKARFRKFATKHTYQRQGWGKLLLTKVFEQAQAFGATHIWCDARIDAKGFYENFGMQQKGDVFYKEHIAYIVMERAF